MGERKFGLAVVFLGCISTLLGGTATALADDPCAGFERRHTITSLGGPNALWPGGLTAVDELQTFAVERPEVIRAVLADQELGEEVVEALIAQIRAGTRIRERAMVRGERLEWMSYRRSGEVATIEDVCLDLASSAPAFEITVPVVTGVTAAEPDCSLEVTTRCDPAGTSTFRVTSAPGAQVSVEGPDGRMTIVDGGDGSWTAPMHDPWDAEHEIVVTNQASSQETVETYTFLFPRECVNLALVGQREERRSSIPTTCRERRIVPAPACPEPPPPSCELSLDRTEVRRGEMVRYTVSGEWSGLELELLHDGVAVEAPGLEGDTGSFEAPRRGSATVVATVTNVRGDSRTCEATVEVGTTPWIARGFGAFVGVGGDETRGAVGAAKGCPCFPEATFGYDDGAGLGIGIERLLTDRYGIEARVLYARLDTELGLSGNGVGIGESDRADLWDVSLGFNVHLTPGRAFDWYVGPVLGYADLEGHRSRAFGRSLDQDPDGAVSWGAQTGLDWHLGPSPWSVHGGLRYTLLSVDIAQRHLSAEDTVSEQRRSLDLDPFTVELGVAYHF